MKHTLLLLVFAAAGLLSHAQHTRTPVAIFPFVASLPEYRARTSQIQEMVIETIRSSPNIELIDRSNDSLLMRELDNQIREQSVAAKGLVEQGKVAGAKEMIVGTVSNVVVEEKHTAGGTVLGRPTTPSIYYTANVSFSLQLSDVESGAVIGHKNFSNANGSWKDLVHLEFATSKESAVMQAVRTCQKQILSWLDESLSPGIRIVSIDQRDGSGYPKTVLVSGIGASARKGAALVVNEISFIDDGNGGKIQRKQKLADMRITERQGDVTVCRITGGEQVIEARINAGAKLECIMGR
ncbi:MAG TPA: hypothetical protein VNS58_28960 [Puia sp.]|nr:hypothetical protein [Puia sp.]